MSNQENLNFGFTGSVLGLILNINGMNVLEAVMVAFFGGIAHIIGKDLYNKIKNNYNEKP